MAGSSSPFGGRKSLFGKEASDTTVNVDLNLTPLMDVMSNILFFLLASFGAAILSYVNVAVPVQSDGEAAAMKDTQVTVNLQITPDAYKINISNDELPAKKLAEMKKTIPKKEGKYDLEGLKSHLVAIKKTYPASETLIVVPTQKSTYEEIVETLDWSREIKDGDKLLKLFPKPVVADIVRDEGGN